MVSYRLDCVKDFYRQACGKNWGGTKIETNIYGNRHDLRCLQRQGGKGL